LEINIPVLKTQRGIMFLNIYSLGHYFEIPKLKKKPNKQTKKQTNKNSMQLINIENSCVLFADILILKFYFLSIPLIFTFISYWSVLSSVFRYPLVYAFSK
jgi:hypothetical protein